MCEFQNGTLECRGDGYLWDADNDGYDPNDHSYPCPNCNTETYLRDAKEEAESTSSYRNMCDWGTGVTIWTRSVEFAKRWNEKATEKALKTIRTVEALYEDDSSPEGFSIQRFDYTQS